MTPSTSLKKWIWGFLIAYVIGIFLYKMIDPVGSASIFYWLLGIGAIAIIGTGWYFWNASRTQKLEQTADKLGPAITRDQCRASADAELLDARYLVVIDYSKPVKEDVREIGKPASKIYVREFTAKKPKGVRYVQAINMHLPDTLRGIVADPKDGEINQFIRSKASYPEQDAPVKSTTSEDPITGRRVTTHEPIVAKEAKAEKEDPL